MDKTLKLTITVTCLSITLVIFSFLTDVIIPIFISVFFAITIDPLIQKLTNNKHLNIKKSIAIIMLLLILMFLVFFVLYYLSTTINSLINIINLNRIKIIDTVNEILNNTKIIGLNLSVDNMFEGVELFKILPIITKNINSLSYYIFWVVIIFILTSFILFERDMLIDKTKKYIKMRNIKILNLICKKINLYFKTKTIISLITGCCFSVFLYAMDIRFFIIWGLLAFILNYIPNIGSIISAIPPLVQTLIFNDIEIFFIVALFYLFVNILIGNILEPKILGGKLKISATITFVSLIFWGGVLGLSGAFLSIPLTIAIKTFIDFNQRKMSYNTQ